MDYKLLGAKIRKERARLNLTQFALAEAAGISDTYMGAIERGERSITLDILVRLVKSLGVTIDYIMADYVPDSESNILEQLKQITGGQTLERRQLALKILRIIFAHFEDE
jgi:transcriptional regulator with XRE-family HTH domain